MWPPDACEIHPQPWGVVARCGTGSRELQRYGVPGTPTAIGPQFRIAYRRILAICGLSGFNIWLVSPFDRMLGRKQPCGEIPLSDFVAQGGTQC